MSIPGAHHGDRRHFEALTAADRPYKQGKNLSEMIPHHDLHEEGRSHRPRPVRPVHPNWALIATMPKRFLKPDQIDEIAIGDYL